MEMIGIDTKATNYSLSVIFPITGGFSDRIGDKALVGRQCFRSYIQS
jgi:hypothetical protein